MATLTLAELNRATLARQMLLGREKTTVAKAIARLLALQAQWPKSPFVALHARIAGFERGDLARAARSYAVVRGTTFRGTIFVMTAKDYAAFRPVVQPCLDRGLKGIVGRTVAEKDYARIASAGKKLFARRERTFDDLRDALAETASVKDDVRHHAYVVRMRVPLLQVPSDVPWGWHGACDFALAEAKLKDPLAATGRDGALEDLVLRYLAALGPATVADAQTFTGLAGLKPVFEKLRPKLVTFAAAESPKTELFDLPKAPRPDGEIAAPVRFLADFDNPCIGHRDRSRFVADEHKKHVYLPGLVVARTFLVDGRVAGTWKCTATRKGATLSLSSFGALTKKTRAALEEEAAALVRFHEPEAKRYDLAFAVT